MDAVLVVGGVALLLFASAHVSLVVMSFGAGRGRGIAALLLPPLAWLLPFVSPTTTPRRFYAALAIVTLLSSGAFEVSLLRGVAHAIDVGGTSAGEPRE